MHALLVLSYLVMMQRGLHQQPDVCTSLGGVCLLWSRALMYLRILVNDNRHIMKSLFLKDTEGSAWIVQYDSYCCSSCWAGAWLQCGTYTRESSGRSHTRQRVVITSCKLPLTKSE
jgi:hypothetical protein